MFIHSNAMAALYFAGAEMRSSIPAASYHEQHYVYVALIDTPHTRALYNVLFL